MVSLLCGTFKWAQRPGQSVSFGQLNIPQGATGWLNRLSIWLDLSSGLGLRAVRSRSALNCLNKQTNKQSIPQLFYPGEQKVCDRTDSSLSHACHARLKSATGSGLSVHLTPCSRQLLPVTQDQQERCRLVVTPATCSVSEGADPHPPSSMAVSVERPV